MCRLKKSPRDEAVSLEMILILCGTFMFGSPEYDESRSYNERLQVEVQYSDFSMHGNTRSELKENDKARLR